MEYANWFVVVMGLGIVFFGLIVLIIAVTIMGKILGGRGETAATDRGADIDTAGSVLNGGALSGAGDAGETQGKPVILPKDLIAAISAAVADDMGTDISKIRVSSIRQIE